MMQHTLSLRFLSEWQIASGIGDGHLADSMLVRDALGIPYLPGRALKGALREGAWRLSLCRPDLAEAERYLWGTASHTGESNEPGRVRVGQGLLAGGLHSYLESLDSAARKSIVLEMCASRAQTALDPERMVVAHSLRTVETGIPGLEFEAVCSINAPELDTSWLHSYMVAVCAAVKSMGGNRARGLGCCRVALDGVATTRVTLPKPFPLAQGARS